MSRDRVVWVERPGVPITAKTIGIQLAAGYPEDQAAIFLAFLDGIEARPSGPWHESCKAIAKLVPANRRAGLSLALGTLTDYIDREEG